MTATLAPPTRTPKDTLTSEDVARRLRVSTKTLANWRYLGRGPAYIKDGGVIRYLAASFDAYIASHEVVPGA